MRIIAALRAFSSHHRLGDSLALAFGLSVGLALAGPSDARQIHARRPAAQESPAPAAHETPDWTVQYGVVSNPRGASGSFGAMLEGRNPASSLP
jgi:hypothetical protein